MEQAKAIELKDLSKPLNDVLPDSSLQDAGQNSNEATVTSPEEALVDTQQDAINRPSVKGAYRPVRNGNISGSILALISSAIATGTLNLPIRAHQLGLIPYTIVLILSILLSYYGMIIMEWIILKYKVQSYAEMVQRAFGEQIMKYSEFMLIFYTWGIALCIEIIFIKFASQLLYDIFGMPLYISRQNEVYTGLGQFMRIVIGILMIVFNSKYLMMTDLKAVLNTIGKSSIVGILFCMSIIWLTAIFGFNRNYNGEVIEYKSVLAMDYTQVEWFQNWDSSYWTVLFQAATGVYFTMLNPQFVFPLISHLKRPNRRRVEYIFRWAHYQQLAIYMLLGWLGYLLLAQHQDVLPISPLVITSLPTWPLIIGKMMLVFALFFRLPLLLFTTKEFIYESTGLERCPQNYKKMNIYLTASTMVVAILFENVNFYFSLIGGTFGVGTAAVIPMLCAFKLIKLTDEQKYIVIFVGVMSVIIFVGGLQSVIYPI